jgi:drug/metabolite transporter (DMT)-like permease
VITITQPSAHGRDAQAALVWCGLAVLAFSFTLPATRIATAQLGGVLLGPGRVVVAGSLAAVWLLFRQPSWPRRAQLVPLLCVAVGGVLGFPLLTALALKRAPAHHAVLLVGLTPLVTAALASVRSGERQPRLFWCAAGLGACSVIGFSALDYGLSLGPADLLLLASVLLVAMSYVEGGRLAREMDGFLVICWALVLALPVALSVVGLELWNHGIPSVSAQTVMAFGYVSAVSQLLGFCAWYRGLALGGVVRGSQVQLLQPVLSLLWSAWLLDEALSRFTPVAAASVFGCVVLAQRARA